ncbi:MAG: hypothetical protein NZ742_03765 [Acidobacteria bacterium]|nr:hypothetical protein [Acidobacteriota bacterium]
MRWGFVGIWVVWGWGLAGGAWGQCQLSDRQTTPDGRWEDVTVTCSFTHRAGPIPVGCCDGPCNIDINLEYVCREEALEAWLEYRPEDGAWASMGAPLERRVIRNDCGPCCDGGRSGRCGHLRGEWDFTGARTVRLPCDERRYHFRLWVRYRSAEGDEWTMVEWTREHQTCKPPPAGCVTTGPHAGDGCCDPAENADPGTGNNLNPRCIALFGGGGAAGRHRVCCRPASRWPPGGDPGHPVEGHAPWGWTLPGWCDRCGGGTGCQGPGDCGAGQVCCDGVCQEGDTCEAPSALYVVIAVYGSAGHRAEARHRGVNVRVPMSFRVWDPAAGRYVWERRGDGPEAPPQKPCRNRAGKVLDEELACWSRPWLVPDYGENPRGIVRTHRIRLSGPRTVIVQPECGVEFNAVLNPAKLAERFAGPVITFDPGWGLRVDMGGGSRCPVRQDVCGDGRPCGVCPDGRAPELDGSCLGGGEPRGRACPVDGSRCEAACVYAIDLTDVYERRETPSWCFEMSRPVGPFRKYDRACEGVAVRPCPSTVGNAYDDWRVSSPWCWEQTKPKPPDIGQPASFGEPPNCTVEVLDGCWDAAVLKAPCGAASKGSRPQTRPKRP